MGRDFGQRETKYDAARSHVRRDGVVTAFFAGESHPPCHCGR